MDLFAGCMAASTIVRNIYWVAVNHHHEQMVGVWEKNTHFRVMFPQVEEESFDPQQVTFDSIESFGDEFLGVTNGEPLAQEEVE